MAKKPTLKDLLGQSDRRVQVEYKGVTEAVTPAVIPSSGSPIPVQEMPKTNQLLQVVDAMNKLPKAYATQIGIAQTEAAEELAKLDDTEIASAIAENDKNTMSIFGFNKAYNEGLVKRHYQVNAKQYEQRLNNIAANLADNPDIKDFNAALENEVETIKVENAQLFSNNRFQLETNDAAFQEVMGEYVAKASGNYLANQQEAVINVESTSILDKIKKDELTLKTGFDLFRKNISSLGINNQEKRKLLMSNTRDLVSYYMDSGNDVEALTVIEDAKKYELFKGARLGSGDDLVTLNNLKQEIINARPDEKTANEIKNDVVGLYDKNLLAIKYIPDEETKTDLLNSLTFMFSRFRPNISSDILQEMAQEIVEGQTSKERVTLMDEKLGLLGTKQFESKDGTKVVAPSDITKSAYSLIAGSAVSTRIRLADIEPSQIYGVTQERIQEADEESLQYFLDNADSNPTSYYEAKDMVGVDVTENVKNNYKKAKRVSNLKKSEPYRNIKTDVSLLTTKALTNSNIYKDSKNKESLKDILDANNAIYVRNLEDEVEEFAFNLNDSPKDEKGNLITREKAIETFIEERIDNHSATMEAIYNAQSFIENMDFDTFRYDRQTFDLNDNKTGVPMFKKPELSTQEVEYKETMSLLKEQGLDYWHLNELNKVLTSSKGTNKIGNPDKLPELYQEMRKDKSEEALRLTQQVYGYDAYDPKAAEDLTLTKVPTSIVKLFGTEDELMSVTTRFKNAIDAYNIDPDGLNEQQLKDFQEATSFGVYDDETYENFIRSQLVNIREFEIK